jgi:hypothetical protein
VGFAFSEKGVTRVAVGFNDLFHGKHSKDVTIGLSYPGFFA